MGKASQTEVLEASKTQQPGVHLTVQPATYSRLGKLGLTRIFRKPASTEQPVLKNSPHPRTWLDHQICEAALGAFPFL